MKITWKKKSGMTAACPCCDPIVFGHAPPCQRWESRNNDGPPMPPGPPLAEGLYRIRVQAGVTGTAEAMRRLGRTTEQFNALMREVTEATDLLREAADVNEAPDLSSPPGPPGGTA
jgi:hypothetical protein